MVNGILVWLFYWIIDFELLPCVLLKVKFGKHSPVLIEHLLIDRVRAHLQRFQPFRKSPIINQVPYSEPREQFNYLYNKRWSITLLFIFAGPIQSSIPFTCFPKRHSVLCKHWLCFPLSVFFSFTSCCGHYLLSNWLTQKAKISYHPQGQKRLEGPWAISVTYSLVCSSLLSQSKLDMKLLLHNTLQDHCALWTQPVDYNHIGVRFEKAWWH